MRKFTAQITIAVLITMITGCRSSGQDMSSSYENFSENYSKTEVAVVGVNGVQGVSAEMIADIISSELKDNGYDVVERRQMQTVISETELQNTETTSPKEAVKAGRILNVDAVVIANIPSFDEQIEISIKLIDVKKSRIIWTGNGSGNTGGDLGTWTGIVTGAVIGIAAGEGAELDNSGKALGGAGGALIGGSIGKKFNSSSMEQTRKVINRICRSLPESNEFGEWKSETDGNLNLN